MSTGIGITAEGLKRTFRGGFTVSVDRLEVAPGHTLAVLGPSGSGKSTLLTMLGLLERPDGGRILLDGREVTARDRAARMQMAAVFQRPYLMKGTVARNVSYGLSLRRVPAKERAVRVSSALERVGLAGFEQRPVGTLSGGEAQRVALARALVLEPRVLLLDEPLSSLDPLIKRRLVSDFASILRDDGVTVIHVTHDQGEAAALADRICIMRQGSIVAEGPAHSILALPSDEWVAGFVGTAAAAAGTVTEVIEGLATIVRGDVRVYSTADVSEGQEVSFGVRPEDVTLFEEGMTLPHSSARNQLPCVVESLEPEGSSVRVLLDAGGLGLSSMVSHASVTSLDLEPGVRVSAVFKATAVRAVPR